MTLFDCHTHHPSRDGERVFQQDVDNYGIHPWKIIDENIDSLLVEFDKRIIDNMFISIGECGLDRLCNAPYEQQIKAFRHQIIKSEELRLPLILHCVKAVDDVLLIKHEMKAKQPWIFHGFRGKPQQLQQLISHNFYISFGFQYNIESLKACPLDKLLLETDDINEPVSILYNKVAKELNMPFEKLVERIALNVQCVFNYKWEYLESTL